MRWMVERNLIWILLLFLFIVEGGLVPWLIPADWKVDIAPHFVLIGVMYIAIFLNRHTALVYGIFFGLLQDVVYYGHMLGPHLFSMGLIGYLAGFGVRRSYISIGSVMTTIMAGNFLYSVLIYGIYQLFKVVQLPFSWVLTHQILPGIIIQLLFALLIYIPARHFFERTVFLQQDEN